MWMLSLLALVCGWLLLCSPATADDQDEHYDPKTQTCRRYSHQTAVIGNRLYIDGGEVMVGEADKSEGVRNVTNRRLLFHDLSSNAQQGMPPLVTNLTKGANIPSLAGGTLWPDVANAKLYLYGGEYQNGDYVGDFAMWMYDEYADAWGKKNVDSGINRAFRGASAVSENLGKGYYFGGWIGETSVPYWSGDDLALNSLLVYDFVNDHWSNKSGPDDGLGRAEGAMFYLPKGDTGLLVHFGGVHVPHGDPENEKPAPMDQIDVYDTAAETWYVQNATGDIPGERRRFCAGMVAAPDNSSYDIYVYAGLGFPSSTGFGDTYILSIPSFNWVKAVEPSEKYIHMAHYDASCNIVRDSQMLIIGQIAGANQSACDAMPVAAAHGFDLGKQNPEKAWWYGYRPNLTGYEVPQELSDVIGGGPDGDATKTRPESDYGDPNLKILFSRTVTGTRAPTRAPPSSSSSSTNSSSTTSSSTTSSSTTSLSPRTLAAITVPTILGSLCILSASLFLLLRRRRQRRAAALAALQREEQEKARAQAGNELAGSPPAYAPGVPGVGGYWTSHRPAELEQQEGVGGEGGGGGGGKVGRFVEAPAGEAAVEMPAPVSAPAPAPKPEPEPEPGPGLVITRADAEDADAGGGGRERTEQS